MPDVSPQDFQAQLEQLREHVQSRLEAHRLELTAAIDKLAASHDATDSAGELSALRVRVQEWEQRERELSERIAARSVEYQALRARTELERFRLQQQAADLETQLARNGAELTRVKALLDALTAEHAECCRGTAPPPFPVHDDQAEQQLKRELEASRLETGQLRQSIENSVALKLARSLGWFLAPLRSLLGKRPGAGS